MPGAPDLRTLVGAARSGEQQAWDALVERYSPLVWAVARGHGLPAAPASDVAHTTWLRVVESLADAPDDAIGEWIAVLARVEALQALRWVDPRPERRGPARDAVWTAAERLSGRCRLALRLLAVDPPVDGLELAAALDLTPDAAEEFAAECVERLAAALGDAEQGDT